MIILFVVAAMMAAATASHHSELDFPTYGELIDLIDKFNHDTHMIVLVFKERYPHIYIGRPNRFIETIQRLKKPTEPSVLSTEPKLMGTPLKAYRNRIWKPRIRNVSKVNQEKSMVGQQIKKKLEYKVKLCNEEVQQITAECSTLKEQFQECREQLEITKHKLQCAANEKVKIQQACDKKVKKLKNDREILEEENAQLKCDNFDLINDLEENRESVDHQLIDSKTGRRYSPELRKLYYTLLADQIPAGKIDNIIRSVLKCFEPTLDVNELELPKKTCASYMRQQELKSISNAHKATIISNMTQVTLNTDGTTKHQKKLTGVVAGGVVLGVNEIPDGSAMSTIMAISKELENLRKVGNALGLPKANLINWSLIVSSTSDSASSQKKVNQYIDELRKSDAEKFGNATVDTIDLIESFCSMHLGINLRKAFLEGLGADHCEGVTRYHNVDIFIHEFCKLFGSSGVPEYTSGVQSFPDFLEIMVTSKQDPTYYQTCSNITLHRQIGSRYFVSASNGCKILLLRNAALEFLKFTGKHNGNKLEQTVFTKLQDLNVLFELTADSLMYYHIYADLFMLSKSNDLELSAYSMNQHYLELKLYLTELVENPMLVFDASYNVFRSEIRLYSEDIKVNHRLKPNSVEVYKHLFEQCMHLSESDSLLSMIVKGAVKMKEKLCSYASKQLPGGLYWDPDPEVKSILCQLKPSNDICESILGLNDYLTTAIPNLHQMSRSNLVEVKKNKTIKWLTSIPQDDQYAVIDYAIRQRKEIVTQYKQHDKEMSDYRKSKMLQQYNKRIAIKQKAQQEKDRLMQIHLITTSQELNEALLECQTDCTAAKIKNRKMSILKEQIKIRKIVLNQKISIPFTCRRRQRPLNDIISELSDFIDKDTSSSDLAVYIRDPQALVHKRIKHRFELDDTSEAWYSGLVVRYCDISKNHTIVYDEDEEQYDFNIVIDILNQDLIVVQ